MNGTWPRSRKKRKKPTCCIWGHPIVPENRYTNMTTGHSSCRLCLEVRKEKARRRQAVPVR